MRVADAQREVRTVYLGGFAGQLVSAAVWSASAATTMAVSPRHGWLVLVAGGFVIFPLTQLVLRLLGRRASLAADNPLRELAIEVAFIVPLLLPLAGAAALVRSEWFYPACMVIVGAHYLPFSFLYGMRHFLALGGAMVTAGLLVGLYAPQRNLEAAWLTVGLLVAFAFVGLALVRREGATGAAGPAVRGAGATG